MSKFKDRSGEVFGRLTVVSYAGKNNLQKSMWLCKCECGSEVTVPSGSLVTGNTTSCGCYLKSVITKHGGTGKGSYNTWRAMMRRCYNASDKDYPRYGAVGVRVAPEWHSYEKFASDMGEPNGDETLDRINTYGSYELSNCRWAGVQTQNRNIRVRSGNKTGAIGVSITHSGSYMAKITVNRKSIYSKCFRTLEEAVAARKELERLHWGIA